MLAAQLTERVIIDKMTMTKDTLGTPVQSWVTLATVYAAVEDSSSGGSKGFNSNAEIEKHSFMTRFKIRHLLNFGYDCRINYEGLKYEIKHIEKLRRQEGFLVTALRSENNA